MNYFKISESANAENMGNAKRSFPVLISSDEIETQYSRNKSSSWFNGWNYAGRTVHNREKEESSCMKLILCLFLNPKKTEPADHRSEVG